MNCKIWQLSTLTTGLILGLSLPSLAVPLLNTVQEPQLLALSENDYVLGGGDRLRLDIFQVEEYSGEYVILVDGTLSLPLVGRLTVAGLTLNQMSELLSQEYAKYLKRPLVTVSLIAPRPVRIAVAGEVNNPGSYEVDFTEVEKFPTVTDIIQQAGGLTTLANIREVEVRRLVNGREQKLTVDLWKLIQDGNLYQDITLRDGDQVIIPAQERMDAKETQQLANVNFGIQAKEPIDITIIGEIYRPGSYAVTPKKEEGLEKGDPPSLTAAIAQAGGIKPLADIRRIEIHRLSRRGDEQIISVNLWELIQEGDINQDILLQEGDKIVIPQAQKLTPEESQSLAAASFAPDTIEVKVVGEVTNPGAVQVPPNTPLNQAILAAGGFNQNRADKGSVELIRLNPDGTVSKRSIAINFEQNLDEENNPPLRQNDVVVVNTSATTQALDTMTAIFSPLRILPLWPFLY